MNFQQLKFVREAIRHDLNLTAAANALFTSQSGVSKQIRELELELGIEIFVRKGKRLIGLTKAGEGAVTMIARVLLEAENLKRYAEQFTDEDRGRLVIATTHNQARYTLPRIAQRFAEEYPDVQLELRQGTPTYAAQAVLSGAADIAIAAEALDAYPDLVTYPCFSWNHVAVVRGEHPLAKIARPTLEGRRIRTAPEDAIPVSTNYFVGTPMIWRAVRVRASRKDAGSHRANVHILMRGNPQNGPSDSPRG